jgi:serine phosphatase RsbU (regulator of sigma subunit)
MFQVLKLSIARKLLLLTTIPLLGAFVLAGVVAKNAREQLRRSEALGSVESLAELSEDVSALIYRLEVERAARLFLLGQRKMQANPDSERTETAVTSTANELAKAFTSSDRAAQTLREFMGRRDLSRLPKRLVGELTEALHKLGSLPRAGALSAQQEGDVTGLLESYGAVERGLLRTIGALTELTDDGELLRCISSLVAVLELQERASIEHALLSYVFAVGDFPAGTYRDFLSLLTEERAFVEGLRTNGTAQQLADYVLRLQDPRIAATERLRRAALDATEGAPVGNANEWYAIQGLKVDSLHGLERELNHEVHQRTLGKLSATRSALLIGSVLAGTALLFSVALAVFIGRGITRSVHTLKDAAILVASGKTNVQVKLGSHDELESLGNAFNDMTEELSRARGAVQEQTRMARDLEIAARIQEALLPPSLKHPDFDFLGRMRPADEVGGDFYDVLSDERSSALWITIGDVSGHGVPAGLVMLMAQSAFGAYFQANPTARPDEVIRGINRLLSDQIGVRLRDDKYLTGLLLTHAGGGSFVFAGGHEWPLIWRASKGCCEIVEAPGPWLGIMPDLGHIPVSSLYLEPGDILCLYSDGLIEARDADGSMFDIGGLQNALEESAAATPDLASIADELFARVDKHTAIRDDDWTLLLVRRAA